MGQVAARPAAAVSGQGSVSGQLPTTADAAAVNSTPAASNMTAAPAAAAAGAASNPDSTEGLWVIESAERRSRRLEDFYEVPDREMGHGHYGIVRKGIRRVDGVAVAVKTVPKRRAVYIEMLRNEVELLRSLDHENIIKLYDEFEDERQVHLIFELCTGGELFEPIADQGFRFSERQASRLIRKLLDSVRYCHELLIVHRDLKPENMLLVSPGVEADLKVIDFGLATRVKPGEVLTRHVGTPYYIAPEVLDRKYGKECDLWGVGVITFTLLCGFPPFWGDTEREIYGNIRRGHVGFDGPDWATRTLQSRAFIQRLLAMQPARRMTVLEALRHPWIAYEGEVPDPRSKRLVGRLRRYAQFPWLKRLGLAVIAKALPPEFETLVRELFDAFDLTPERQMTLQTLRTSLRARGLGATDGELQALLRGLDLNRDGVVTFTEFAAAAMPRLLYMDPQRAMDVFAVMDVDRDGRISLGDVARLVGDAEFAAGVLAESDADGDGIIDFAEFLAMLGADEPHAL